MRCVWRLAEETLDVTMASEECRHWDQVFESKCGAKCDAWLMPG